MDEGRGVAGVGTSTSAMAKLVDSLVDDRVLVHGSLPGRGRDLDLLVRPLEEKNVSAGLSEAGYSNAANRYVRFVDSTAEQVELIPVGDWDLPDAEARALFEEAVPIPGYRHLVRPSPAHMLLIVARRIVEGPGVLDEKRMGYIQWALETDAAAWEHAEARAEAWKAERPLELLIRLGGHAFVPRSVRVAVIEDRLLRSGRARLDARLEALRQTFPPRPRPAVVSISGLDGSGKSTQARILVDSLERIGIAAATEWAKVGEDRRLWPLRQLGQKALLLLRRRAASAGDGPPAHSQPPRYFESGATVGFGWPVVAALSNVLTLRSTLRRYTGRAEVLVYDRYVIDTRVHLAERYGLAGRKLALLEFAVSRLSPSPLRAYYLSVDPGEALNRKHEDAIEDLEMYAASYRRCLERPLGRDVIVLDGALPVDQIASRIGTDVWRALQSDRRHGLARRLGAALQRRARKPGGS